MRIAFDVSILAQQFARGVGKTGIYRTVEELVRALSDRDDVEMAVTGICGPNPVASAFLAALYVEECAQRGEHYRFVLPVRSRLGLEPLYARLYRAYAAGGRATGAPATRARAASRAAGQLSRLDLAPDPAAACDLLHSTYLGFPPRRLTGRMARVLTVYDLIPIVAPQFVRPSHSRDAQRIIDTMNPERDWAVCISEYAKQELCGYTSMDPDRVRVTPLAASAHFHPVRDAEQIADARLRYGIPQGDYLLSIASLEPRKNLAHLIRSFSRACAAEFDLDLSLVLVGSKGWMYEEILSAASSDPLLGSRVVFTGHIPDSDLSTIYSGAAAFVYPSLHEGFGLPPLEAMQCGAPVITSNTTSLPEVVGDAAITVDPSDGDALCDAILRVLSDTQLRADLRRKGLARARDFSWARCAGQTVELYRTAIGHP